MCLISLTTIRLRQLWNSKKNRRDHKPVSVIVSIIYLRNLPPDIGRAALICQYIWSCRPWYRTRMASLTSVVSSYLAFSPSPAPVDSGAGSYFLLRLHKITPICAFRSRVPFPVRTFLTGKRAGAAENPALNLANVIKPDEIEKLFTSIFIKTEATREE